MTRFWIRVNARLVSDPAVQSFAAAILPKQPTWLSVRAACGLLVALWGTVVDEQEDGNLSARSDDAVEEMAGWRGKRGLFAREFRARFVGEDGIIREWTDYQGKLIERREKDRRRKSGGGSAGIPQETPQEVGGNSARIPRPHVHEHGQALASAPYGAEEQEPTPGLALAPEGAAPAVANDGNSHFTASAREALHRRGVRDEQIDAAPRGNLADHTADLEFRQTQYDAELDAHSTRWMQENPDETAEIGAAARVDLNLPVNKGASGLSALQMAALKGAVVEEIRKRNDWPRLDAWDGCEFKTQAVA